MPGGSSGPGRQPEPFQQRQRDSAQGVRVGLVGDGEAVAVLGDDACPRRLDRLGRDAPADRELARHLPQPGRLGDQRVGEQQGDVIDDPGARERLVVQARLPGGVDQGEPLSADLDLAAGEALQVADQAGAALGEVVALVGGQLVVVDRGLVEQAASRRWRRGASPAPGG